MFGQKYFLKIFRPKLRTSKFTMTFCMENWKNHQTVRMMQFSCSSVAGWAVYRNCLVFYRLSTCLHQNNHPQSHHGMANHANDDCYSHWLFDGCCKCNNVRVNVMHSDFKLHFNVILLSKNTASEHYYSIRVACGTSLKLTLNRDAISLHETTGQSPATTWQFQLTIIFLDLLQPICFVPSWVLHLQTFITTTNMVALDPT